ncbi:hemerythrin domain-containing protein [Marinilabiliaceae bacterium ANBcel2]|nr:hemerythrin domain-containing protein [Marinilabiliaceae bacterium ANBcel2]
MRIHSNMKMADLVEVNFEILEVIQRLQIPFGFKDKTIDKVCKENNIEVLFFLQLAQWFIERENFPQEELMQGHPNLLITYLHNTHKCYLEHQIPRIEQEIKNLEKETELPGESVQLMIKFFKEYINEFTDHLKDEEEITFPYIQALEKANRGELALSDFNKKYKNYSIDKYLANHSNLEEKIVDLQSILLKYMPPPVNNCKFTNLLLEIYRLGKDLKDHTLLEENVLIPKVRHMEIQLKK